MEKTEIEKLIQTGRDFLKGDLGLYPDYQSDQDLKIPQPPLVKPAMRQQQISLPMNFDDLNIDDNFKTIINQRQSHRVYTQQDLSLLQLSYLLWATQGIKDIRGKKYATLRTVPCGGARHQFETYLLVQHVQGLQPGLYHYLPMEHQLEFLGQIPEKETISASLVGQDWALKASVIFYYSIVCYRVEWRYGIFAHRTALIDIGHVGENLYLASTALHLGCCGVAAFDQQVCDQLFQLDGQEEFILYTSPVGTIQAKDKIKEQDFYAFIQQQNLIG